jgi:hypothetical protein
LLTWIDTQDTDLRRAPSRVARVFKARLELKNTNGPSYGKHEIKTCLDAGTASDEKLSTEVLRSGCRVAPLLCWACKVLNVMTDLYPAHLLHVEAEAESTCYKDNQCGDYQYGQRLDHTMQSQFRYALQ